MTKEEAIRTLEYGEWWDFLSDDIADRAENPLHEALNMAVAALREQEQRRWIPVTESPKGNGCYIVAVNHWVDGKPVTREAYWNGCDWLSCDKKRELTPQVTHWMPLPEPPKEA